MASMYSMYSTPATFVPPSDESVSTRRLVYPSEATPERMSRFPITDGMDLLPKIFSSTESLLSRGAAGFPIEDQFSVSALNVTDAFPGLDPSKLELRILSLSDVVKFFGVNYATAAVKESFIPSHPMRDGVEYDLVKEFTGQRPRSAPVRSHLRQLCIPAETITEASHGWPRKMDARHAELSSTCAHVPDECSVSPIDKRMGGIFASGGPTFTVTCQHLITEAEVSNPLPKWNAPASSRGYNRLDLEPRHPVIFNNPNRRSSKSFGLPQIPWIALPFSDVVYQSCFDKTCQDCRIPMANPRSIVPTSLHTKEDTQTNGRVRSLIVIHSGPWPTVKGKKTKVVAYNRKAQEGMFSKRFPNLEKIRLCQLESFDSKALANIPQLIFDGCIITDSFCSEIREAESMVFKGCTFNNTLLFLPRNLKYFQADTATPTISATADHVIEELHFTRCRAWPLDERFGLHLTPRLRVLRVESATLSIVPEDCKALQSDSTLDSCCLLGNK
jgi:hypothetical protein